MNELNSYNFIMRTLVSVYMRSLGVELFVTRTVHEILWGFKDPILSKVHTYKPEVDEYFGLMWKVSATVTMTSTDYSEASVVTSQKRSEICRMLEKEACISCL